MGDEPLHILVQKNELKTVKLLIDSGEDVNSKDNKGKTPLFFAVQEGNLEIAQLLIDNGADLNSKDKKGKTPLFFAVQEGNLEIVQLLINNGAYLDSKDNKGITPLYIAVQEGNLEIAQLLIDNGADVNLKYKLEKIDENKNKIINTTTVLFLAVRYDRLEIVKLLINNGAEVDIIDSLKQSPLSYAISNNNLSIVKLLINKGVKETINIPNDYCGFTPLHLSIELVQNLEIIKILIENGALVNAKDKDGYTCLNAIAYDSEFNKDNYSNYLNIAKLLIENGADLNNKNKFGKTPLHNAVHKNKLGIVKLLIENRANVNAKDNEDKTPLHIAVENNNLEIVQLLIENGADLNIKSIKGDITPVEHIIINSIKNDHISQFIKLFVEKGAVISDKVKKYLEDKYPEFYNNIKNVISSAEKKVETARILMSIAQEEKKQKAAKQKAKEAAEKKQKAEKAEKAAAEKAAAELIKEEEALEKKKNPKNPKKSNVRKSKPIKVEESKRDEESKKPDCSIEIEDTIDPMLNSILKEKELSTWNNFDPDLESNTETKCCDKLCGTLAITCFITKTGSDKFYELISAHGLWEKQSVEYTDINGLTKNYKKPEKSKITENKYDKSLFFYKNTDNKVFPCIDNKNFISYEWNKHGVNFDNYTEYDQYFNDVCRLSKPILNILFLEKYTKLKEGKRCTFEDYKTIIENSKYAKYLVKVNVTERIKEFQFSVSKVDGVWKFSKNDDILKYSMKDGKSPRRKSPRRKSPRRKSPRKKSPRKKSPRKKSLRRK